MDPVAVAALGSSVSCIRCRRTLIDGPASERRWYWCVGERPLEPVPAELAGRSLGGRVPEAVLGRGGAALVLLAREGEREVAVKRLTGAASRNPRTRTRFARELEVASALTDPGVVRVLEGQVGEDEAWIAMERVRGPSLRDLLREGPLPVEEAVRIGVFVARTLARLHAQDVAHRDVKPSNLLLTPDGTPLLTDFGLVALLAEEERLRLTTHAVGTPAYMAPEQVRDPLAAHDGRKLDQFALGLLIEECVTGRLADRSALEASLVTEAHPVLGRVLAKAHHPDPGARYRDMAALAEDLERVQQGRAVRARPPGPLYRLGRRLRAVRGRIGAGLAAAGLLVAGSWGLEVVQENRAESAALERLDEMEARAADLRRAGRVEEARQVFDAFVSLPENQGRDAVARAWLARGRRALSDTTFARALDGFSAAFVAAVEPTTRADALRELEQVLREAGRFREAYTLRREANLSASTDDLQLVLEVGDLDALADRLPPTDRRRQLVERLQLATELPARVRHTGDLDGDGRDDDLFLEVEHRFGMPLRGFVVRDVMEGRLVPVPGSPLWLRTTLDGGLLERHEDGTFTERCTFDGRGLVPGDVQVDAVWLLDHGRRRVVRLDRASCERSRPLDVLRSLRSFPLSMDAADLDGDGVDELVVAMGPSEGHGVWVLQSTPEGWVERANLRLGYVPVVQVVDTAHGPRIVATTTRFHPNPELFPEPPHMGEPGGQHILTWTGDALVVEQVLLARSIVDTRERRWVSTWFGHVDDDGYTDIVTNDGYAYLSTPDRGAPFERVPLGLQSLDFIVDADGDGRVEIGATLEDRTFLLGLGPPRPSTEEPDAVPPVGEPALDAARALERFGLASRAAEAYVRIGRGRTDERATDALVRAAGLFGGEHPEASARAAEEAASRGRLDLVPLAVERYLQVLAVEDAARVVEVHGARLPTAQHARLREQVASVQHRVSLIERPAVARVAELVDWEADVLELQTVLGAGPLLQIPLRQTGEVVGFHVTFVTDAMEFASELDIGLANGVGQPLGVRLIQRERGGVLYRYVGEVGWGKELEVPSWRTSTRFDVKVQELPDTSWVAVELHADGELLERTRVPRNRGRGTDWLLSFDAPGAAGLTGQMAKVRVERLEVTGLEPDARALPLQGRADVRSMASDPQGRALLHARLRNDPMVFRELVDTLGPDDAFELTAEAFMALPDDARGVLPAIADLEPADVAKRSPRLARVRAALLCGVDRKEAGAEAVRALPLEERCGARRLHDRCGLALPAACDPL